MASEEQIQCVITQYQESCPHIFWKKTDTSTVGLGAVIRYLMSHNGEATSGQISEEIHVSTARVAVLLKKMEQRGWIRREKELNDKRVTVVKLTPEGMIIGETMRENMHQQIGQLIDEIGIDKLMDYMEIRTKIFKIVDPSKFCIRL